MRAAQRQISRRIVSLLGGAPDRAPFVAPQQQENDEQLFEAVDKLANRWLVMRATGDEQDSKLSHHFGMNQHDLVQEAIAEVIERGHSPGATPANSAVAEACAKMLGSLK